MSVTSEEGSSAPRRHPGVEALLGWFQSDHLPEDLRDTSRLCEIVAKAMVETIPDDPELTAGLRKLLEAKDCFVRARVAARKPCPS